MLWAVSCFDDPGRKKWEYCNKKWEYVQYMGIFATEGESPTLIQKLDDILRSWRPTYTIKRFVRDFDFRLEETDGTTLPELMARVASSIRHRKWQSRERDREIRERRESDLKWDKSVRANKPKPVPTPAVIEERDMYVYLMKNRRNGYYKIGYSVKPEYREKTLQSEDPDISMVCKAVSSIQTERELHQQYADKRLRGEWFNLTKVDVFKIVKELKSLAA